jgi:DNA-binding helix-hairpin-helix protein with protein kinase domain
MASKALGLLALIGVVAGFALMPALAVVWLGVGGFGLFKLFGGSIEAEPFRRAYAQADQRARDLEIAFLQRIGLAEIYGVRDDLEGWITQYRQLDADLNRELANLRSTREARQRDAFLDRYLIRRAKISGIGPAKSATLASFGIETAADINERAVLAVPGFGDVMTAKLMRWRRALEARFHYNPAPDASDIQAEKAVRSASAAKRSDLQSRIRSGLAALQTGPQQVTARAKTVDQALINALGERANAAHDLRLLGLPVPAAAPITISPRPSPSAQPQAPLAGGSARPQGVPNCPRCGSFMVRRTARHGFRSGSQFWGCSRYPACTGTRN